MGDEEEFLEDTGQPALSTADLDRLLERARLTEDRELQLLVEQYQALKRVAGELLERTESTLRGAQAQQDQIRKLAHFLIKSDDPSPPA